MSYLTDNKYKQKLRSIQIENHQWELRQSLKNEKNKSKRHIKKPSTSKVVMFVSFLLIIEIVAFCQVMMWHAMDFTSMYALIGIVASLIPIVIAYYNKSKAENTVGGIVYDMAMKEELTVSSNDEEPVG